MCIRDRHIMASMYPYRPSLQMVRSREGIPPIEVCQVSRSMQNRTVKPQYQKKYLNDMDGPQRTNRPPERGVSYRSTHLGHVDASFQSQRPADMMPTQREVIQDWCCNQYMLKHHPVGGALKAAGGRRPVGGFYPR
eukprot:TRINITY_DN778_c0_g1_i1.p1 TRINITY_DN778_c0_g1~~TRINITY_DN778_c0_g1_i1.p1  ORF type:complete len:136 (+),score=16.44 TRINITY_DN778_c0_g1_i1:90-497(+)